MQRVVWVVVADATRARLFGTDLPDGDLDEFEGLLHAEGRSKASALVTDRPGRGRSGALAGSHTLGHEKDIKNREAELFARQIVKELDKAHHKGKFRRLYLLASERMLGLIKKELSVDTMRDLTQATGINLVQHSAADIRSHLPKRL